MKILSNKYGINLITGIVIFLLFVPAMLIEFLNDWIMIYGLIALILYPIYSSIGNYFYFREKSAKNFLINIYLVIFGTILNLGLCMSVLLKFFVVRGPEIAMIFILGFVYLILTIIGSIITYFTIKSYEKRDIESAELKGNDLICLVSGSVINMTKVKGILLENGINSIMKENSLLNHFEILIEKRNEKESLKLIANYE